MKFRQIEKLPRYKKYIQATVLTAGIMGIGCIKNADESFLDLNYAVFT